MKGFKKCCKFLKDLGIPAVLTKWSRKVSSKHPVAAGVLIAVAITISALG